jgi:aspartate racemase
MEDYILLVVMHHIVCDGWSARVFTKELAVFYETFSTGTTSPLPELPIQYADHAYWQRQRLQGEVLDQQVSYWRDILAESPPLLDLPTDRPRRSYQTFCGANQTIMISSPLQKLLKELSRKEDVTLFMTLLAAFKVLLYRYTGQMDIVVGSPIAGRSHIETEDLIGFFVNTLVLRTDLSGNPSFRQLLQRIRKTTIGAYEHGNLPLEKVVEVLKPERELSRNPFFQVLFNFENVPEKNINLSKLNISEFEFNSGIAAFDLSVEIFEKKEELYCLVDYNTDIFESLTITRMTGHYKTLLESLVADPDQRVSDVQILTYAERQQLLIDWNDTSSKYPRDRCVHQLFEEQVEQSPDAVAVAYVDEQLTYRKLNARANQLAHYLKSFGIGPEVLVGICLERSLDMIIAVLGILKAGGAYVPLDPEYPQERLAFMLADTQTPVLLTQQKLLNGLPEIAARLVCLDSHWEAIGKESHENPISDAVAENLAYVMYTSGSTGRPKGVCVTHRNVVRLVKATNYASLGAEEVFLQFAPISFDASTLELWGPLLNGGRLVVFPAATPSLAQLGEVIEQYQVTTLWLTAGLFHQMVEDHLDSLRSVGQLLAGGDVLSVPHVKRVLEQLDGCCLINGYGPTENTTFTTCYRMTDVSEVESSVPIGRPIANTQVYILDPYLQPVPIGVPGQLYTGGDGLARGYLNRPELTAEKFISDPFSEDPAARLYKTGDLARYLPDGSIEFLGRVDHQVKIRGFRIELGEVESVLGRHPAVEEAVVIAREDVPGDKRLVAYLVASHEPTPTFGELRSFLKEKLPDYMIPSAFVYLDSFPITPNGKVDRRALPVPDARHPDIEESFAAPRNAVEEALAEIWAETLRIEKVGIQDNLFELGGHSLMATLLISRLSDVFLVEIPLRQLLLHPTIAELAIIIEEELEKTKQDNVKRLLDEFDELSEEEAERLLAKELHQNDRAD